MQYTFRAIDQWPRPFTKDRKRSPFRTSYNETLGLLENELYKVGARNVVIQLALRPGDIRLDGLPRANARPAEHPGVILSFEKWFPNGTRNEQGQPLGTYRPISMPCDAFTDWESNLRAIALSLEALRKVDRYGVTQGGEQYKGWATLPEGNDGMSVEDAAGFIAEIAKSGATQGGILSVRETFVAAHRQAMRNAHPDNGGTTADFQKLQHAAEILKKHHGL